MRDGSAAAQMPERRSPREGFKLTMAMLRKAVAVLEKQCPGGKLRSKGRGRGEGRGKGKGPLGDPKHRG